MKKYILITFMLFSVCIFSQEKIQKKDTLKFRADIRFDQVRFRLLNKFKLFDSQVNSLLVFRTNRFEYYEEFNITFDDGFSLRPALGLEYDYKLGKFSPRLRAQARMDFRKFFFMVNYGSDIVSHGVSTRSMFKIHGRLQIGIQSSNEFMGPRIDWEFCALKNKNFKLGAFYLRHNDFGFSLRFNFYEFFPKWKAKVKKIEKKANEKLNPFYKKSKT